MIEALFVATLLLIWAAILSWLALALAGAAYMRRAARAANAELPSWPGVSILVPAHNEEEVIATSVRRLLDLDYPRDRLQLVVVDDGSTDATGEILDRLAAEDARLRVVHVAPAAGGRGKSAALNRGLRFCRHPLLAVYDADTRPRRDALRRLVAALDASHVAVVGRLVKVNTGSSFLRRLAALEFTTFQWTYQAGRSRLWDVVLLTGTNYLIRADIVRRHGGWDPRALTEDLELSVRLYADDLRVAFASDAVAEEQDPASLRTWVRQRTRWLVGNYYVLARRSGAMVRSRRPRAIGVLWELLWIYVVFVVALVASETILVASLAGRVQVPVDGRFLVLWLLAFLVYLAVVQVAAGLDGHDSWRTPFLAAAMYFLYCPLWLFVLARALVSYVLDKGEVRWFKTPHTAS